MKLEKDMSSSFDDFLEEENLLAEADAVAIKRVIAFQNNNTNMLSKL